jgi:hypothetical protein
MKRGESVATAGVSFVPRCLGINLHRNVMLVP